MEAPRRYRPSLKRARKPHFNCPERFTHVFANDILFDIESKNEHDNRKSSNVEYVVCTSNISETGTFFENNQIEVELLCARKSLEPIPLHTVCLQGAQNGPAFTNADCADR
jgi:hypothetical protein